MPWSITARVCALHVEGEVHAHEAAALRDALIARPGDATWELLELDLEDGVAVAELVNAVDALRARGARVELRHAPQMLAHTLYKVGRLGDPGLVLVAPRADEGLGAG